MNHRSLRASPAGSTAWWCHCSSRCVLVKLPLFSVCAAAGRKNTSVPMSCVPAAAHTEKSGSFTNTQRLLQWHNQAIEPAGDARSDLWFTYHLGRRIREKLAASTEEADRPLL